MYYCDIIMGVIAPQITSLTIVYSTVYSGTNGRKHQSSATLAFVRGIHRWIPRTKGQVFGKSPCYRSFDRSANWCVNDSIKILINGGQRGTFSMFRVHRHKFNRLRNWYMIHDISIMMRIFYIDRLYHLFCCGHLPFGFILYIYPCHTGMPDASKVIL